MMWPQLQDVAQVAIGHMLNSLPEGLLIAGFAWMTLRLLPPQNSGTRFAIWLVTLLAVAGLPFIGSTATSPLPGGATPSPLISLSGRWGMLLFLVWILAVAVALLRVAAGLGRIRKLRRSCAVLDASRLDPAVAKTVANFNSSRPVVLAVSERLNVPAAIGFFQAMVVIPAWALRELAPEELNIVLLHEFAHLRRWDDWTNLLQKIVRAIFVFHPAVWWIENRLSLEREMACDDLVLAATGNPRGYAKCLVALLEKNFARRGLALAQAAVHRAHEASLRLARILDVGRPQGKHVWKPALGLVGVFSVVCLAVVPHVPRVVAFEQNAPTPQSATSASAFISPSQFSTVAMIPATLQVNSALSRNRISKPRFQKVAAHLAQPRRLAPLDSTPLTAEGETSQAHVVNAALLQNGANQAGMNKADLQPLQTLFVVRTTQWTGPDSWTWSVYVWRVTWISPDQSDAEKTPVAHKT